MPRLVKQRRKEPGGLGGSAWRNRLVEGDNLLLAAQLRSELPGGIDLIYVDPPFATGRDFEFRGAVPDRGSGRARLKAAAYRDSWGAGSGSGSGMQGYVAMMDARLQAFHGLLGARGSIIVHVDYRAVAHVRLLLDRIFGAECFQNEIVWHYSSGGSARSHYPRKHDSLLWYGRGARPFFDASAASVARNVCQHCGLSQSKWNNLKKHVDQDGRVYRTIRSAGKIYRYYDDEPALVPDVWLGMNHLQQQDPERTGYPTQKPLRLLDRIVRTHCPPGGLVADFFCGSGTTLVAAQNTGRRWIGCDSSPVAIRVARKRLSEALLAAEKARSTGVAMIGFEVARADLSPDN